MEGREERKRGKWIERELIRREGVELINEDDSRTVATVKTSSLLQ